MRIHQQIETQTKGTSWVIKNQDDVTICRSPKRYKTREAAIDALDLFMDTVLKNAQVKRTEKDRT